MTRIIAIRPEPGLSSTLAAGRELGLPIVGAPLFEVRALPWDAPDPGAVDALLIGSANAVLHGGENLEALQGKPVHAVGAATAKAAEYGGFTIASLGSGGLQNVLDEVPPPTRLLRIAGAEHVPLAAPKGVQIQTIIAYESAPMPLDPALLGDAGERRIILLHSAAAATHFTSECKRLGVDPETLEIAALGPRIASAAGKNWSAIHVSERPSDAALLAMVKALCQ